MNSRPTLAVVMDPITDIKFSKDSTLAMLLAAQADGFELRYLEMGDLMLRDGVALGRTRPLKVFKDPARWFELGDPVLQRLGDLDAILMRKDPPFDTEYIYATYILERAEDQGALVVNRPRGLRDMNEKVYTAWFPQCCAPTLVTRNMDDMRAFVAEHGKAVAKPFDDKVSHAQHMREHAKEKPCKCDICGLHVQSKTILKRHIDRVHKQKAKPFECSECDKRFHDRHELQRHQRP